jgi:hypothetical protein
MDANSFLMGGGGAPTAKFPTPGTTVGGRITEQPKVEQQRDIQTGEAKIWSNGDPMMQLVVTVQTDQRDPAIEDDDGRRRLFVKGQMKNAVSDAVRQAGGKGLEVGGTLQVRYTHDGEQTKRGFSAPKQYAANYTPAAHTELAAPPAQVAGAVQTPGAIDWNAVGAASAPAPAAAPPGVNTVTGEMPPF